MMIQSMDRTKTIIEPHTISIEPWDTNGATHYSIYCDGEYLGKTDDAEYVRRLLAILEEVYLKEEPAVINLDGKKVWVKERETIR